MSEERLLWPLEGTQSGWLWWCPACEHCHCAWTADEANPERPSWTFDGNAESPSFDPSFLVNGPGKYHVPTLPTCHTFVKKGKIQYLSDCTHALVGQTVPMVKF